MMPGKKREYDWLDDPFNEKPSEGGLGIGAKIALFLLVAFILVILLVLFVVSMTGMLSIIGG